VVRHEINRVIETKVIVRDILSGMTDVNLMKKYDLSSGDLEDVFRKLLDIQAINHIDVMAWSVFGNRIISTEGIRLFPRQAVDFLLPIFESDHWGNEGLIRDVSRNGLSIKGLDASVGDVKNLAVSLDLSRQVVSVPFEAVCRWIKTSRRDGASIAGYLVSDGSQSTWKKILNGILLVRYLVTHRARA
jgi:hypothetical protein